MICSNQRPIQIPSALITAKTWGPQEPIFFIRNYNDCSSRKFLSETPLLDKVPAIFDYDLQKSVQIFRKRKTFLFCDFFRYYTAKADLNCFWLILSSCFWQLSDFVDWIPQQWIFLIFVELSYGQQRNPATRSSNSVPQFGNQTPKN